MKAHVFNVQRWCLQDGQGIRTTVFFKGCPLSCVWCHNPESQRKATELMYYESKCVGCGKCLGFCDARAWDTQKPGKIAVDHSKCTLCGKCIEACQPNANEFCGREEDTADLFAEVLKDRMFYQHGGGMTLSGGEPAMQPEASLDLLARAAEAGISAVVETCGFGTADFYRRAHALGATFYFDLKCMLPDAHKVLTGVPSDVILSNLEMLMQAGANLVLRLPLVPGMNDSDEALDAMAQFLADRAGHYDHAEIMKYHNLGLSKSRAAGHDYRAPAESATAEDAARWLAALKRRGAENISFS